MNRIPLAALAIWLAVPALAQDRPQNYSVQPKEPEEVRVGAWNMKWFPSGSKTPKPAKDETRRIGSAARFLRWQMMDVVMFEEMRSAEVCSNLVGHAALEGFRVNACSRFPQQGGFPQHQNAIVSRYPAVDAGWKLFDRGKTSPPRGMVWAVLDIGGSLYGFVGVHLKSNYIPWWAEDRDETAKWNRAKREDSAEQLVAFADGFLGKEYGERKVRAVFIGGDMNTSRFEEAYKDEKTIPIIMAAGYRDVFEGVPVEQRYTMLATRDYPNSVFDYLFVKGDVETARPETTPMQYTSDHRMIYVHVSRAAKANEIAMEVPESR